LIWDGGLFARPGIGTGILARPNDPRRTERILWQWTPFGDDNAIRRPLSVLGSSLAGILSIAFAIDTITTILDAACVGRICGRGYLTAPAGLLAGAVCLSFPWIDEKRRVLLTGTYSLTDAHFVRTRWRQVISFPLRDGRILIRYGCAWFEPSSGARQRLTPRLSRTKAARLFAAIAEAREIQRNRGQA
jgi:hypothetical protein